MNLKDLLDRIGDFETVSIWFGKENTEDMMNLRIQGRGTYDNRILKKELYPDGKDSGSLKVVKIWTGIGRIINIKIERKEQ